MKKLLLVLFLVLAACGGKPDLPANSIPPPEIREADNGGVFITPEPEEPEEFCYSEIVNVERGPYHIDGFLVQGWYMTLDDERTLQIDEADHMYLVGAEMTSSNVDFDSFIEWIEVEGAGHLLVWVDEPEGRRTQAHTNGSVDLAGLSIRTKTTLSARNPSKDTKIGINLKFRRLYSCRESS